MNCELCLMLHLLEFYWLKYGIYSNSVNGKHIPDRNSQVYFLLKLPTGHSGGCIAQIHTPLCTFIRIWPVTDANFQSCLESLQDTSLLR